MKVEGFCPMGCGSTLFLAEGGYVTCSIPACPNPTAVSDILAEQETEHVVEFGRRGFTVKHPLRERVGDALLSCDLRDYIVCLDGPPTVPGRYRAVMGATRWVFYPGGVVKRSPLTRRSPLKRKAGLARRMELARTAMSQRPKPISPATPEQRLAVAEKACIVCAKGPCDPAHLIDRSLAPSWGDDPRIVIPLCGLCHYFYDHDELDLSPHLEPRYREQVAVAVEAVGLFRALNRITGKRWAPVEQESAV